MTHYKLNVFIREPVSQEEADILAERLAVYLALTGVVADVVAEPLQDAENGQED